MISETLKTYIPSRSYVEYLEKIDHSFTDYEEAGILCHSIQDVMLLHQELLRIKERTDDENLREQIEKKITQDLKDIELFKDNSDRNAIYVVTYRDPEDDEMEFAGFGSSFDTAYAIGMKTSCEFNVKKKAVFSDISQLGDIPEEKAHWNPYLGKPADWEISEADDEEIEENITESIGWDERTCDVSYGTLDFDKNGRLIYFWVKNDEESDIEVMERVYSNKVFYNAFIPFPYPFEKGDFVCEVSSREDAEKEPESETNKAIGIVDTSREDYEDFLERAKTTYVDAGDASVTVQFIYKNGSVMHNHIMPIFLEKTDIEKDEPWFDLARMMSWTVNGEGSIDFLLGIYESYKSRCQSK